MEFLKKTINRELKIFQRLSESARSLTFSIILFQIADITTFIFSLAYMFQQTGRFEAAAIFNLGFYLTLPPAYMLNAWILKRISIKKTALIGLVGSGLVMISLFLTPNINLTKLFMFGLLYGFPMGIYWSTRTFLFTSEVTDKQRDYVSGLTSSSYSMIRTIVPMIVGWLIVTAPGLGFAKVTAYRAVAVVSAIIFTTAGLVLKQSPTSTLKITKIWLKKPSRQWQRFRLFILLGSIQFTITLALPESLIIAFLGHEGILGTVIGGISLISGLSLYFVGRKANSTHRTKILTISLLPLIIASFGLLISFSKVGIIFYLMTLIIFDAFFWYVYFPILSNQIEQHNNKIAACYPYILDHEIFTSLGRVITSLLYLAIVFKLESTIAISITVVVAALSQIGLLVVSRKINPQTP